MKLSGVMGKKDKKDKKDKKNEHAKALRVRIGPNRNILTLCEVNKDYKPLFVYDDNFIGNVTVRVVNFAGVTPDNSPPIPMTDYFGKRKRLFSVQIQGRFRKEWSTNLINFGGAFDNKVTLPIGAGLAIKLAQMIDPALENHISEDEPSMTSPLLCQMNFVNVTKAKTAINELPEIPWDKLKNNNRTSFSKGCLATTEPEAYGIKPEVYLDEWIWGGSKELTEDTTLLLNEEGLEERPFEIDDLVARRKYFQKEENRENNSFTPDKIYNLEIFAPFINLNTFDISLGININILKYLNDQPLKLVARTNENYEGERVEFLNLEFDLVDKEVDDDNLLLQPKPVDPEFNEGLPISPSVTLEQLSKKQYTQQKTQFYNNDSNDDSDDFEDAFDS